MSILNVSVSDDDTALVAVDTAIVVSAGYEGGHGASSKFVTLAHSNVLLAVRGPTLALRALFWYCHEEPYSDMDALGLAMPGILLKLRHDMIFADKQWNLRSLSRGGDGFCDFVMVGWSARRKRMVAESYQQQTPEDEFTTAVERRCIVAPGDDEFATTFGVRDPQTPAAMKLLALAQCQYFKAEYPGRFGGSLILAKVRRRSIVFRTECDLPGNADSRPLTEICSEHGIIWPRS